MQKQIIFVLHYLSLFIEVFLFSGRVSSWWRQQQRRRRCRESLKHNVMIKPYVYPAEHEMGTFFDISKLRESE